MRHGKYPFIIGFLALPLLFYAVFVISPFLQAFYIAATDWSGLTPTMNFIGLDNFGRLAVDPLFWTALWHNIVILIAMPVLTIALALFFAFMLNLGGRNIRGKSKIGGVKGSPLYKILFFFPQVLSIPIIAILWQYILSPDNGLLKALLGSVGIPSPVWLGDPSLALMCVLLVMVWWQVGFYIVLFSAGMASVPNDIYEAALIDGANRFTTFFRITLPLIADTVQTGWVYLGILAMDSFAIVQIMTIPPGGPDNSTLVVPFYIYKTAFGSVSQAGYATAMGVAMMVVTLLFAILTLRLSRRERIEF